MQVFARLMTYSFPVDETYVLLPSRTTVSFQLFKRSTWLVRMYSVDSTHAFSPGGNSSFGAPSALLLSQPYQIGRVATQRKTMMIPATRPLLYNAHSVRQVNTESQAARSR